MPYLATGEKVHVVAKTEDGTVVRKFVVYDSGGWEIDAGEMLIVDRVFENPPVAVIDAEIVEKAAIVSKLEARIEELENRVYDVEREHLERIKRIRNQIAVEGLDAFLEDRTTHYFVHSYRPQILAVADAKCQSDKRSLKAVLLHAFKSGDHWNGRPEKWEFSLNIYHDGSGSGERMTPCTSYEQAQAIGQKLISEAMNPDSGLLDLADKHGLKAPDAWREHFRQQSLIYRQNEVRKAKDQLDKANAELAALDAK